MQVFGYQNHGDVFVVQESELLGNFTPNALSLLPTTPRIYGVQDISFHSGVSIVANLCLFC